MVVNCRGCHFFWHCHHLTWVSFSCPLSFDMIAVWRGCHFVLAVLRHGFPFVWLPFDMIVIHRGCPLTWLSLAMVALCHVSFDMVVSWQGCPWTWFSFNTGCHQPWFSFAMYHLTRVSIDMLVLLTWLSFDTWLSFWHGCAFILLSLDMVIAVLRPACTLPPPYFVSAGK